MVLSYKSDNERLRDTIRRDSKLTLRKGVVMDIQVVRSKSKTSAEGTPGKGDSGAGFLFDTLELQWADNQRGISCIKPAPDGDPETYAGTIWYSPNLGREVVRLENKYGRFDCLLHNATWAGEAVGDKTQIHGCTAVGHGYAQVTRPDGVAQFGILHSKDTLAELIAHIKEQVGWGKFTVTYSWGE